MKKSGWLVFTLLLHLMVEGQNIPSPDKFLGYPLGTKFTRHHAIVEYCKAIATAAPQMVQYETYGETYEGRPLVLCYISSADNMQRLESIRMNNLRLAGLAKDKMMPVVNNAPAIVWLSYNVHGNEPASSEAAMQTLYELVNPANNKTKEWLKNTVIILDPCLNPDGRDRYVNWYNSVVAKPNNVSAQAREHMEPWPQGRSNHYNFDLNRDWAWQSQIETRHRIKKYNQWMPQVHVDYHEQGFNEPYYFAPAAEPLHQVITPWQKTFQALIGKNNAAEFDKNGWLFFTKERFDLFYPSYGDTYPTYNGAIGMTYEQGGIRAGLGVLTNEGDTLTLTDRITHHTATGLSTIATVSNHATSLINEYKLFFDNNRSGKNFTYKTYVLTSNNLQKLQSVAKLLQSNGIEYGSLINNTFKGLNYQTRKEENAVLQQYHLAVSLMQPKSSLASVLLEPSSSLNDSITYDITAWSMPYAHGVSAYAVKEALPIKAAEVGQSVISNVPETNYGYLIKYNSLNSARILVQLLNQGVKVRFAEKPFVHNKQMFDPGTLIVLLKGNVANVSQVVQAALQNITAEIFPVTSGMMDSGADFGSPDVKLVGMPKVAMFTGEQVSSLDAGEIWHFFEETLQYPITLFNVTDWARVSLKDYQVLIMPDGRYNAASDKGFADKLKEFVKSGGKVVAMQNAINVLSNADWGMKLKEDKADEASRKDEYNALKKYADREKEFVTNNIPGAVYKLQLDNTHPLAFGYPDYYYTLKQDPNMYEFLKDGWNVGVLKKDGYITGFSGNTLKPKLKDGLLMGVQEIGAGNVVYLNDNVLFRSFWENGKLLFCNAVFMVGK